EVLLLGSPWPAIRAGTGACVGLLGSALARRPDSLTTLAFAAATCAAVDPAAAHDLALQLSIAGIAGLILLARPIRDLLPLPLAPIVTAAPGLLACLLWYGGVALCTRRSFRFALVPWALLALVAGMRAALASARNGMTITFLAVGQGDSAVVQFPGGASMLIDAGGDLRWPGKFDPGARDVVPALAE